MNLGRYAGLAGAAVAFLALPPVAGANVRADFNDDGFEDLAIGIEGEDLPAPDNVLNAGAVTVIYGSSSGLDATGPPADQFWHEEVAGVRGSGKGDDGFGAAVAAGDFDGDGRSDLAIGATGDDVRGKDYAGSLRVLYGGNNGLTANGDEMFTEATKGVPGVPADLNYMASTLAAGDFDADGDDDVVATLEGQRVDGAQNAGAVLVFKGSNGGLKAGGAKLFTEGTPGIAGEPAPYDGFGDALAAADFRAKGPDELAIGVPADAVGATTGAGTVRVLFGGRGGLTANGDRRIDADQGSIVGNAEQDDHFGSSVAGGSLNADKADELVIGVPDDDDSTGGAVDILEGAGRGPSTQSATQWSQSVADVLGTAEVGDRFGASVTIGDFDDEIGGDLAVGVPGDNDAGFDGAGAVNVIYGDGSGLTPTGDQLIEQSATGVEGTAEAQDQLGSIVADADFNDEDGDDLAIVVPFDDAGAVEAAGAVQVFYGSNPNGLTASSDELFHQGLAAIENEPTENEYFGFALNAGW
ncbi:MAG: FG-GAP repeat protein [Solirubrobacterales bacterium]|jgi:hypothetical protein